MSIIESFTLSRPNQWEQIWDGTYESDEFLPGRFQPLDPIEIPFLLSERVLAIATSSTSARAHWTYAGTLIQQHQIPDLGTRPIDGHSVICRLNATRLELMSDLTADYQLLFTPPKWIRDISISIWRYTGAVNSQLLDAIQAISDSHASDPSSGGGNCQFQPTDLTDLTNRVNGVRLQTDEAVRLASLARTAADEARARADSAATQIASFRTYQTSENNWMRGKINEMLTRVSTTETNVRIIKTHLGA